jgi:hypothetical protein
VLWEKGEIKLGSVEDVGKLNYSMRHRRSTGMKVGIIGE